MKVSANLKTPVWVPLALLISGVLLSTAVCGDGSQESSPQSTPISPAEPSPQPTAAAALEPTATAPDLQTLLISSDIGVGPNRLVFGLVDRQSGTLKNADVQVSTFHLAEASQGVPKETAKAVFREWPTGRGVYTAGLTFDAPGTWGLAFVVTDADGSTRASSARIQVKESSLTPAIGSDAPRSVSKTARDVERLEELTTDPDPDPDLYAITIAEAIESGKPLVAVFGTPAYCTTATCGPQVNVLKRLKEEFKDGANFIHIEVFDNPLEIQGDLARGRISPTVIEWGLPTDPWTFITDSEGLIHAKFEGYATMEELEDALAKALQ